MARLIRLGVVGALALVPALAGPAQAGAATTVGQLPTGIFQQCTSGLSVAQTGVSSGAAYTVPAGGGVLTSWSFVGGLPGSMRFVVWRPGTVADSYTAVGVTQSESLAPNGPQTRAARIPVQAGDLLGVHSTENGTACRVSAGDGNTNVSNSTPTPVVGVDSLMNPDFFGSRVNASAQLEPDADGDGFGDETQDTCPADSAATAPPCAVKPPADATAPQTTIDKGPKRKTTKKRAKFTFSSSEPGSTFECSLDRKPFTQCASPHKVRVKRQGKHKLQVRATDAAGNTDGTPATASWKVKRARR